MARPQEGTHSCHGAVLRVGRAIPKGQSTSWNVVAGQPRVPRRLIPIHMEAPRYVRQQLCQLHGVPGPAAAACLINQLEPRVTIKQNLGIMIVVLDQALERPPLNSEVAIGLQKTVRKHHRLFSESMALAVNIPRNLQRLIGT